MAKQKRRNLLISLSVALALVIAVCGFGAYANTSNGDAIVFSNEVTTENTTKGKIDQIQYAIDGEDKLVPLNEVDGETGLGTLLPAYHANDYTFKAEEPKELVVKDSNPELKIGVPLWGENEIYGAIDDIVCVKNISLNETDKLYIRTVFAFECGDLTLDVFKDLIRLNMNTTNWKWSDWITTDGNAFVIDNEKYYIIYAEYIGKSPSEAKQLVAIDRNAVTEPSLIQFALAKNADKEDVVSLRDGGYKVLVSSQGASISTEFGDISATSHPWSGETTDTTTDTTN